jgi:broad-specificity NMP kinase
MLIVLGGLPGTGKTTVAKALAQKLDAVHLRVDAIEQALRSSGVLKTDAWLLVAEQTSTKVAEIEFICSDAVEHRRRVETRRSDIEELKLPAWQDVIEREYENWDRPHIVIDTASKTVKETVAELLAQLGFAELP